jgi:hypothetical protein
MRFHHAIETTTTAEDPIWQTILLADEPEEYTGSAAQYGRDVLTNWTDDQETDTATTDEYGNPLARVVVRFDSVNGTVAATIGTDDLDEPPTELAAVEAARDAKLYTTHLDTLADNQAADALTQARAAGHGVNSLARLIAPAYSRPIARRMMQQTDETDPVRMYMAGPWYYCLDCAPQAAAAAPSAIRRSRMAEAHRFTCDICHEPIAR